MKPFPFLAWLASEPHPAMILPFAGMLLSIALMPFVNKTWWERHYPKVATGLGLITVVYYVFVLKNPVRMFHVAHEYFSFVALIGALFVVAGGIHVSVKGEATPLVNSLFLFVGAILANVIGTTGASMLLVRPWIRMNKYRITSYHTVFFIFIISNVGGCLTPVGDPPLFLGYLKGVPFGWVLKSCWPAWLIMVPALITAFVILDRKNFLRAPTEVRERETARETWRISGLHNLGFLALILAAIFVRKPTGVSELLMVAAAIGSYFATPAPIHESNDFNFHPIREVAWLFLGIFATMAPALDYLEVHGEDLGLSSEMALFWVTGSLSATLDNAPTYLTFLAAAMGVHGLSLDEPAHLMQMVTHHGRELMAISLGAVFFGAMTYIGNGPNFMVKAIAEHSKVKTPGFFEYILRYAIPILLPLLALVSTLFFSRFRVF